MYEDILKIVYDANREGRILSRDEISDITNYLIYNNSLSRYCLNVNTEWNCLRVLATYAEYEILIDYKNMLNCYKRKAEDLKIFLGLNNKEQINFINNQILFKILYLINSVKQSQIIEETGALSQLLNMSFLIPNSDYIEYNKIINAYYKLINDCLSDENTKINYHFNSMTAAILLHFYNTNGKLISPIGRFNTCFKDEHIHHEFIERVNQREGNIDDILLGRNISDEEYKYIYDVYFQNKETPLNLFRSIYK